MFFRRCLCVFCCVVVIIVVVGVGVVVGVINAVCGVVTIFCIVLLFTKVSRNTVANLA